MEDIIYSSEYEDITGMIQDIDNAEYVESEEIEDEQNDVVLSGNDVNNYYYNKSVSINYVTNTFEEIVSNDQVPEDDTVSYNIVNKPLNEYTPIESMSAFSILFCLGIGFVLLVRRTVFKWK